MPSQAGASFITTLPEPPDLAPWTGLGILILWAIAGVAIAAVSLRHRDAWTAPDDSDSGPAMW